MITGCLKPLTDGLKYGELHENMYSTYCVYLKPWMLFDKRIGAYQSVSCGLEGLKDTTIISMDTSTARMNTI